MNGLSLLWSRTRLMVQIQRRSKSLRLEQLKAFGAKESRASGYKPRSPNPGTVSSNCSMAATNADSADDCTCDHGWEWDPRVDGNLVPCHRCAT